MSDEVGSLRQGVIEGLALANGATPAQLEALPAALLATSVDDPVVSDLLLSTRIREPAELHAVAHYLGRYTPPDLTALLATSQPIDGTAATGGEHGR